MGNKPKIIAEKVDWFQMDGFEKWLTDRNILQRPTEDIPHEVIEPKQIEFEKRLEEILSTDKRNVDWDLIDFGVSLKHIDENGKETRIEPFSDKWNEIIKQLPDNNK